MLQRLPAEIVGRAVVTDDEQEIRAQVARRDACADRVVPPSGYGSLAAACKRAMAPRVKASLNSPVRILCQALSSVTHWPAWMPSREARVGWPPPPTDARKTSASTSM